MSLLLPPALTRLTHALNYLRTHLSRLLPSYLVAAFIKRTLRLAIHAPPSAIAYVMPFAYNMLLRHPQCMPMIHREKSAGDDPFVMEEADPAKCNALDRYGSSLCG